MEEKPQKSFYPTQSALTTHNFFRRSKLRQDPLDLRFWSFLTFLHHDRRSREASSVKISKKRFEGKVGQMCHQSCSLT